MSAPGGPAPSPVVLITGGATGIGRAVAAACGRSGATVVLLSLPGPELSQAIDELSGAGVTAQAVAADVRDFAAVQQAAGQVHGELGRIDALVASAGIADQSSITSGSPERWQQVVQTNLLGTANAIRAVAPLMLAAGARGHRDDRVGLGPGQLRRRTAVHREQVGRGRPRPRGPQGAAGQQHPGRADRARPGGYAADPGRPVVRPLVEAGGAMLPGDIAEAVVWLLARPRRVSVTELVIRPTAVGDIERI